MNPLLRRTGRFLAWISTSLIWAWGTLHAEPARAPVRLTVIGMIEDFDAEPVGSFQRGFLESYRWTEDFRREARGWSSLEIVSEGGNRVLRARVGDARAFSGGDKSIVRLAPFYPPESDAVRIRLKVVSGQASIYVGGPTAYFGNSDIFTRPHTVIARAEPQWEEVVCNLNHPTWRNFRRSGFSTDAPRNYYNRWAQEPLGVFLAADSTGEVLIDRIDLVNLGEGRPFAKFAPAQVRAVEPIIDFEDGKMDRVFNLFMSAAESEWFEESWKRGKALRFEPMRLSLVDAGMDGRKSLQCEGRTAEEVHCTGVRASGAAQANAIAVTMNVDVSEQRNVLVGGGRVAPIDFLVFVAPTGAPFPWLRFAAPEELRAFGGPGFDYQFTHRTIAAYTGVDFAIYHTRRYLPPGEWSHQVLPAADFSCVYGHGAMRERFTNLEPLRCGDVIAIAWLNPWCRTGRAAAPVTTRVDTISFVQIPGAPAEHRSFWQVPDVKQLRHREETRDGRRVRHTWLEE